MNVATKLTLFTALLAIAFGSAVVAGGAVGPASTAEDGADRSQGTPAAHGAGAMAESNTPAATKEQPSLPGLAVAQDGFRLVIGPAAVAGAGRHTITLRIEDAQGQAVRRFDVRHDRRLHLIVVRRDLSGFQHLHPTMAPDGTWSVPSVRLAPGTARVFADFTIGGVQRTLGTDLQVPGPYSPEPVPAPAVAVKDDRGLEVRLRGEGGSTVAFDVLRGGKVINDELEDFLGAKGHLVTLRAGDLAYLHNHPDADRLAFGVDLEPATTYRSWVQFKLRGQVHTAAFTQERAR